MAHRTGIDSRSVAERKRELRCTLIARRKGLPPEVARRTGDRVSSFLEASGGFQGAGSVAMYAATGGEPDLRSLFEAGARLGKRMLLPRCSEDGCLTFHPLESWNDLVVGRFGLLEPMEGRAPIDDDVIDLVLLPCVAVDRSGWRLGRGGGWYDRTFAAGRTSARCLTAVVHAFQIVEQVPSEPTDRRVDAIVSELGLGMARR